MKRQEFQDIVHEVAGENVQGWGKKAQKSPRTQLEVEWRTGGMWGGNCWGDQPSYSAESDPEPNFDELDTILEKVCPDIPYLQYKKLDAFIKRDSYTQNEYYGNCTHYAVKRLAVEDLWNFLVDLGYGE